MNHKTVNISNFESYIIDYFDGALSSEEQQALFAFLEAHPQLMDDFELFKQSEDVVVTSDSVTFPYPERLKKNVIFSVNDVNESVGKQQLKHTPFRRSAAIWIAVASVAAVLLLFFLFKPDAKTPSSSVVPETFFVQTDDNEPETSSDTMNSALPVEALTPQKEFNPKPAPISLVAHTEKIIPSTSEPDAELLPESSEQHTEIAALASNETIKTLEPDVVLIKTISESDPVTEDLLSSYQEQQQKKGSFWKVLSWGVKQYNHVANDDIAVMKVENLTTNETTYYLCRGE